MPDPETVPDPAPAAAAAELSPAACSARLAQLFPALFALQRPLPLKLRIQADIQQRAPDVFTKKTLSIFLHRYTTGTPYLLALTQQRTRHDLDGQPAGEVAAEHRDAATAELERRRALHAGRREQERVRAAADDAARRDRAALLRAFETTTLTRANFLALKGLTDDALDDALQQARQDRSERPPAPQPVQQRPDRRPPDDRRGPDHGSRNDRGDARRGRPEAGRSADPRPARDGAGQPPRPPRPPRA